MRIGCEISAHAHGFCDAHTAEARLAVCCFMACAHMLEYHIDVGGNLRFLCRCYKLPLANNAAVPPTLRKEMSGVCKACFAGDSRGRAGHMQVTNNTQHLHTVKAGSLHVCTHSPVSLV
jgi:hypothetical protein